MTRDRQDPKTRKAAILGHAVQLAKEKGYSHITRDEVATRAEVACGLVTYYFKSIGRLKREIMHYAIRMEHHDILLQGLAAKDLIAERAPKELKAKAVEKYATTVTL